MSIVFCDDDLDKEEIERVFNLIIQSENQKIIEILLNKYVAKVGILPEGYKTGWNDCVDEIIKELRGE